MWDVFISYSSEDREAVVTPLARHLQRMGVNVWLDKQEIHLGDGIREKIDHGLTNSVYGIVVLSKSYFEKTWTKRELDGLFSIEEFGKIVIIPVWHQIDKSTVTKYSPLLANRLAADTADGIDNVAREIVQEILGKENDSPFLQSHPLYKEFKDLLDNCKDIEDVRGFLLKNPNILRVALQAQCIFNPTGKKSIIPELGAIKPYICVGRFMATEECWKWSVISFGSVNENLFLPDKQEIQYQLRNKINQLETCVEELDHNTNALRRMRSQIDYLPMSIPQPEDEIKRYSIEGILFFGRRRLFTNNEKGKLREINKASHGINIRSYDLILDTCLQFTNRI